MGFDKIDVTKLSKLKYIYYFFTLSDGKTVMERFPIVYINHKYVYFARPGQDMLSNVNISECYETKDHFIFGQERWTKHYYVLCPTEKDETVIYNKLQSVMDELRESKIKEENLVKYLKLKQSLETTLKNIKELEKAHPELLEA